MEHTDVSPMVETPTISPGSVQPVIHTERIQSIDVIRGFALCGILLMNVVGFGMPVETIFPKLFTQPTDDINFKTFKFLASVCEGTMRALFSMLFGAGILLFTAKKEDTSSGYTIADFYYRRLLWLILFGLINAYVLLWHGDILFAYGVCGLFLFPFRKLKPGYWLAAAGLCMVISMGKGAMSGLEMKEKRVGYLQTVAAEKQHRKPTAEQQTAKTGWLEIEQKTRFDPKKQAEIIKKMRSGYGTVFATVVPVANRLQTVEFYDTFFWDVLVMIFLGMALFKWGFFSNQLPTRTYVLTLLLGYGIGLPLGYLAFWDGVAWFHNPGAAMDADSFPFQALYHLRRASTALGHPSLLLLLYRSRLVPALMGGLANVGQLAFTNYLMQSVLCTLFFYGYGLGYYGTLTGHQLLYVVAGVWVIQFIFSAVWLRYFRLGPLEWLWRSLTYWKWQPIRYQRLESY